MANLSIILKIPILIADTKTYLTKITSKIYQTAGSIRFIKTAVYHEITQKFAQVHGRFINKNDKTKSERGILLSHYSNDHVCRSKDLLEQHLLCNKLKQLTGKLLYNSVMHYINTLQYNALIQSKLRIN